MALSIIHSNITLHLGQLLKHNKNCSDNIQNLRNVPFPPPSRPFPKKKWYSHFLNRLLYIHILSHQILFFIKFYFCLNALSVKVIWKNTEINLHYIKYIIKRWLKNHQRTLCTLNTYSVCTVHALLSIYIQSNTMYVQRSTIFSTMLKFLIGGYKTRCNLEIYRKFQNVRFILYLSLIEFILIRVQQHIFNSS